MGAPQGCVSENDGTVEEIDVEAGLLAPQMRPGDGASGSGGGEIDWQICVAQAVPEYVVIGKPAEIFNFSSSRYRERKHIEMDRGEIWRYQSGVDLDDTIYGAVAISNGSFIVAGETYASWGESNAGASDLLVARIASNGTLLWAWQNGTLGIDTLKAVAALDDDSVVVAGYVEGAWNDNPSFGLTDFAAVKLHSNGTEMWSWQEGTTDFDYMETATVTADDNIVLSGHTYGNWTGISPGYANPVAVKLDANGMVLWRWQEGTAEFFGGVQVFASTARPDGSVVLAGFTDASWFGALSPEATTDFMAVALDNEGAELWRWQDGSDGRNRIYGAASLADGSVVLVGSTDGDWGGKNEGGRDFAAVKLDVDGVEKWRWQDGTTGEDEWTTAVSGTDGSIIVAGHTQGSWMGSNKGDRDFAAMSLDAEGVVLWTYQNGTIADDKIFIAAFREEGDLLLAGSTNGSWESENSDGNKDFAAVLLDTGMPTITTPSPVHLSAPSSAPTSPSPVHSLDPSSAPTLRSASSSGSSSGTDPIIIGVVVAVAASLAVIGVFFFRRTRVTSTVGSPAPAEDGDACYPQAVTPPSRLPPPSA